ncbi:hypothetical protein [Argonema galeatum]|uniref:hypothetical protein n=1 Tax=Argonema galeatum TaxID=2942762 RepID=UPI002012CAA2|nr:hypothetical protein [Argonema galeatum]MCL1464635.1 hypothetical protein [Argonema galeatum A003/A1]
MTFQTDKIQAAIAEIDDALGKSRKFSLGWFNSGANAKQRRVLERVRSSLQTLQQQLASRGEVEVAQTHGAQLLGEMPFVQAPSALQFQSVEADLNRQKTPQQILQAVVEEMGYLRTFYEKATTLTSLTEQCQADLEALQQQRQVLVAQIQELEQQRQNYASQLQAELKQKAWGSLSETETSQQTTENISSEQDSALSGEEVELAPRQVIPDQTQNAIATSELPLPYAGAELIVPSMIWEQLPAKQEAGAIGDNANPAEDLNRESPIDRRAPQGFNLLDIAQSSPPTCRLEDAPQLKEAYYGTVDPEHEVDFGLNDRTDQSFERSEKLLSLESGEILSSTQNALDNTRETKNLENFETIAALTDLIEATPLEEADYLADEGPLAPEMAELGVGESPSLEAGSFLPASPDEDLLPTGELEGKSNIDIWLAKNMLEQLSEDLSTLEGVDSQDIKEQGDILQARDDSEPCSIENTEINLDRDLIPTPSAYLASPEEGNKNFSGDGKTDEEIEESPLSVEQQTETGSDETKSELQIESHPHIEQLEPEIDLNPGNAVRREEIPCTIPDEILAEFDDLFGESLENIANHSDANLDLAERSLSTEDRELEKKN